MPNDTVRASATALPKSSRRLFLAAGTAAAVCATLKSAAGLEVDPIFAAIKRHNEAWRAFGDACPRIDDIVAENEGREVTEADEEAYEAANDAEEEAFEALITLPPVTIAGMRAAMRYFIEFETDGIQGAPDRFLTAMLASPVLADGRA
jgi:hypothetical protein